MTITQRVPNVNTAVVFLFGDIVEDYQGAETRREKEGIFMRYG